MIDSTYFEGIVRYGVFVLVIFKIGHRNDGFWPSGRRRFMRDVSTRDLHIVPRDWSHPAEMSFRAL